jgi:hypothetical protein
MVEFSTPTDGYDAPRQALAIPRIGTPVQKYGRTTIYSNGHITALNAIAIVGGYGDGLGFFHKQIEIANLTAGGAAFSTQGDSGSVIVVRKPGELDDRAPVALLFAGGPSGAVDATLANPIGAVLARFGLAVDDGTGTPNAGTSGTMGGAIAPLNPPSRLR